MADLEGFNIKITADTSDAMEKLTELRGVADTIPGVLLETKTDLLPWFFATFGWIAAVLIAVLKP